MRFRSIGLYRRERQSSPNTAQQPAAVSFAKASGGTWRHGIPALFDRRLSLQCPVHRERRRVRQKRLHRNAPASLSSSQHPDPAAEKWRPACLSSITSINGASAPDTPNLRPFPIWNLPLGHPVNLAYEAATADMGDVNMIDPYHLEAYGISTVNYNRDIEIFPVLKTMFENIYGVFSL